MRVTKKVPEKAAKMAPQASRGTAAWAGRGLKQPPKGLTEWIRLANLIRGHSVPEIDTVSPGSVDEKTLWPKMLEWVAKLEDPLRSELLAASRPDWASCPDPLRAVFVASHCNRINVAANLLRRLAKPDNEQMMDDIESFVVSLRYADLSYLRECEHCGNVFYAGRASQVGCTPAHGSAIRKKRKRERDKANREYNERKKKRAKTAPKR